MGRGVDGTRVDLSRPVFDVMLEVVRGEAGFALHLDAPHYFGVLIQAEGLVEVVPSDPGLFAHPDDPAVRDALLKVLRARSVESIAAGAVVTIGDDRVVADIQEPGDAVHAVDFTFHKIKKGMFKREFVLGDPRPTSPTVTIW